jgi:hypothetical protein
MNTKYMVYNPKTGKNTYTDTEYEAKKLFIEYVIEFIAPYFHNVPYIQVNIDNDIEIINPTKLTINDILNTQS